MYLPARIRMGNYHIIYTKIRRRVSLLAEFSTLFPDWWRSLNGEKD